MIPAPVWGLCPEFDSDRRQSLLAWRTPAVPWVGPGHSKSSPLSSENPQSAASRLCSISSPRSASRFPLPTGYAMAKVEAGDLGVVAAQINDRWDVNPRFAQRSAICATLMFASILAVDRWDFESPEMVPGTVIFRATIGGSDATRRRHPVDNRCRDSSGL
jgi:hypothetical protein